jgi:hypothetical protein
MVRAYRTYRGVEDNIKIDGREVGWVMDGSIWLRIGTGGGLL